METIKHQLQTLFFVVAIICGTAISVNAQTLAAGGSHSVFVCATGEAKATGGNDWGQLGNGTLTNAITPTPVKGLTGIVATASRDQYILYLLNDGTVWAAGYNGFGQFGNGTTTASDTAIQIPQLTGVTKIATGFYHSLFLKSDSTVWACGRNFSGEVGDGTQTQRDTPVQVSSLAGVIDIAAGDAHSLFLLSDGTVWSCGDNQNGSLGLGASAPTQVANPTQITSISGVKLIAGGFRHSLFVKQDGTAWACGFNNEGQLGDGTIIQKDTVIQVNNLTNIIGISAGQYHSLFLKGDGTAWGAGYNAFGQLGNGDNVNQLTPVQVSGLAGVTKVSASGFYHSLFLKSDQTFWGCGQNNIGQIGDGTITTTNVPVLVLDSCSITSGVSELANNVQAVIYPNPSTGVFQLQVLGNATPIEAVEIYNLVGELVYGIKPTVSNQIVDLSNRAKGIYFYQVKSNNQVTTSGKIVVN